MDVWPIACESKQDRIKVYVLLTSYEMINLDTASLKPIKRQRMIVYEGHRPKIRIQICFYSLKQNTSSHCTLLTGTPLQARTKALGVRKGAMVC
ncbi:CHD3-type chromatin-remodeling factor PICKLE-like [Durio zibethinus]|uniref:CHD3-type chromatin-remodeling factor PICKLE-like n=1 Tax=Durio zibethinus TaxID=66656 RepID=A0A6P5ZD78_DURZI|nr:CHD3-type chromatin-remodeling factor PICKLE-like [Durio zibethinus]